MNSETTLIIADSHDWIRKTIVNSLKDYRIRTIGEASSGEEVIHLLKIELPDVLILHIDMPVMNGNHTMQYLSTHYPKLKVLILTSFTDETLHMNYILRGAKGILPINYLLNPFQLVKTIFDVKEERFCEKDIPKKTLKFTQREIEVIPILTEGKTSKEIALILKMSEKAVNKHRVNILKKCKVRNVGEFINSAIKKGYEFLANK
jgi:DNA-binding NarL/FixJ family response regulator